MTKEKLMNKVKEFVILIIVVFLLGFWTGCSCKHFLFESTKEPAIDIENTPLEII